jgi:hypothetical protein
MTLNQYVDGNAVDGEALDGMRWMGCGMVDEDAMGWREYMDRVLLWIKITYLVVD